MQPHAFKILVIPRADLDMHGLKSLADAVFTWYQLDTGDHQINVDLVSRLRSGQPLPSLLEQQIAIVEGHGLDERSGPLPPSCHKVDQQERDHRRETLGADADLRAIQLRVSNTRRRKTAETVVGWLRGYIPDDLVSDVRVNGVPWGQIQQDVLIETESGIRIPMMHNPEETPNVAIGAEHAARSAGLRPIEVWCFNTLEDTGAQEAATKFTAFVSECPRLREVIVTQNGRELTVVKVMHWTATNVANAGGSEATYLSFRRLVIAVEHCDDANDSGDECRDRGEPHE